MRISAPLMSVFAVMGVTCLGARAEGATITAFTNGAAFFAATGATNATGGPLPDIGLIAGGSQTVGDVTITTDSGSLFIGTANLGGGCGGVIGCDWTIRHAGADIAISGNEDFHVDVILGGPVFSFGFDFVKAINDPSYVPLPGPSIFTVTLMAGASVVGSFSYLTPSPLVPADTLAFIGLWSSQAFDRAVIVETVGGIDDEYWGEFYTGKAPNQVPEPAALLLLGSGLTTVYLRRRRITSS